MNRIYLTLIFLLTVVFSNAIAQEESQTEIEFFIIDSYVTPDKPYKIMLMFYTSEDTKSKVIFADETEFNVSKKYNDEHRFELNLSDLEFDSLVIPYRIIAEDRAGIFHESDEFDILLPNDEELLSSSNPNWFTVCCFGGIIFGLPSPTLNLIDGKSAFGLSKEIPIVSFYSSGYNFPVGYFGIEYSYLFDEANTQFLRFGYKHIFQLDQIQYIAPGVNYTIDFNGYTAISPELSVGLLKIYNAFTLFTRYRYNYDISGSVKYHEISLGLYSNFFSFSF
ncbi:MAG: hypothetical protein KJ799_05190 [Bacteroidetes bacterium]|nr:hypothetical protein [Bacteroidota bacterium]